MMLFPKPQAIEPMDADDLDWQDMMLSEWVTLSPQIKLMCWFDYLDHIKSDQPRIDDHRFILRPLYNRLVALSVLGVLVMHSKSLMSVLLARIDAKA